MLKRILCSAGLALLSGPVMAGSFAYGGGSLGFIHAPGDVASTYDNALGFELGGGQTFGPYLTLCGEYASQLFPLDITKLGLPSGITASGGGAEISYAGVIAQLASRPGDHGFGVFFGGGLAYGSVVNEDLTLTLGSLSAVVTGTSSGGWLGVYHAGFDYRFTKEIAAYFKYKGIFENAQESGLKLSSVLLGLSYSIL